MEEQMSGIRPPVRRWLILLPILIAMLACSFLSGSGASITPVPQDPTGEVSRDIPAGPDPLDRLLELRSIQFNLTALQPDGASRSVQGEIDSAGNMHLKLHSPVPVLSDLPENFNMDLKLPEESELYVVDGKAYQPDDQNPTWMLEPVANDYVKNLSGLLHGPDGPGLWLDLLPAGSLKPAGQATVGGFAADKYMVNVRVHDQIITGSLWYESHALVRVELHIPAALFAPDMPAPQGELKVTLDVQKTAVSPVMLPTPPAETPGATSQP